MEMKNRRWIALLLILFLVVSAPVEALCGINLFGKSFSQNAAAASTTVYAVNTSYKSVSGSYGSSSLPTKCNAFFKGESFYLNIQFNKDFYLKSCTLYVLNADTDAYSTYRLTKTGYGVYWAKSISLSNPAMYYYLFEATGNWRNQDEEVYIETESDPCFFQVLKVPTLTFSPSSLTMDTSSEGEYVTIDAKLEPHFYPCDAEVSVNMSDNSTAFESVDASTRTETRIKVVPKKACNNEKITFKLLNNNNNRKVLATQTYSVTITESGNKLTYDYRTNGGSSASKKEELYKPGSNVDLSVAASKSGWDFVGWNTNPDATSGLSSFKMPDHAETLYAIYKKSVTAKFVDYNGSSKRTREQEAILYNNEKSKTITPPSQGSYSGWSTRGWATSTSSNAEPLSEITINSNKTFYGLYERTLTLSYNANGGSSTPSKATGQQYTNSYSISSTKNPTITLANEISKSGASFSKWAKGSTTGSTYNAGANITISDDTTMYALWNENKHSVTYNYSYNGGSSAKKSTLTVSEGDDIDLKVTASKSTWSFVGWNTDPNATSALSSLKMGTKDITLYAIFKKTIKATFIDYSGSSKRTREVSETIYNKATEATISPPSQGSYSGWSTRGWSTSTGKTAEPTSEFKISSDKKFYGLYQRNLTLSYNANGGNRTPSSQSAAQYTNSYSISSTANPQLTLADAINKSGATFYKWAKGSTSGTKYTAGEKITISENTTMYATWTENKHTVTYNYSYNGGSSAKKSSATVAEDTNIALDVTAAKSGWTFVGWNTNPNATNGLSSLKMGNKDVTLYAVFKKTLTAVFHDYSGTSSRKNNKSVTIYNNEESATVSAPAVGTYSGWVTRGWATDTAADADTTKYFTISSDKHFYGVYQRTLRLSYNANGGSSTPTEQTGTQYANSYRISSTKNPSFRIAGAVSKSGYTFDAWAKGNSSGTKYDPGETITIGSNTTMVAVYTKKSAPHSHKWGSPSWNWTGKKATADFYCSCGKTKTVKASVNNQVTKATMKSNGSVVPVATVTLDGKTYRDNGSEKRIYAAKSVKLSKKSFNYSGSSVYPNVVVKDSRGKTISSANYSLKYKNNNRVGKGTVIVKFKNYYSGKKTLAFTIKLKTVSGLRRIPKSSGINYQWNAVPGASYYQIYLYDYNTKEYYTEDKISHWKGTTFGISNLRNTSLKIKVRAVAETDSGKLIRGKFSSPLELEAIDG